MRTILRNGLDRYEVLKADQPLRRGERLVRFASERGALEFLIGVGGPARRDLHRLVDDDFAGGFSGVRGDEVPAEITRRVARGELKIAHVEAAPPRVRSVGGEFVVLEARDRLRRGESWVRVMDEATAIRFARLLSTLPKDQQRRLMPVAVAVGGGSQREQTRSLSRLLRGGQIRIARLQTLTRAGGSAPPEPEMSAFGVADAISLGVGFIPIVGDAVDIAGAIVGKDLITGENLTPAERLVTAAGTLLGSGKAARMGMNAAESGLRRLSPLADTRYSPKVRAQMKQGDYHAFPLEVDNFAGDGVKTVIRGGDGVARTKIELRGSYRGKDGVFEWIVEPDKSVNHRLFRPDP
ncbi:MAG TPA: pre-toxin TG domain-containing protein [Longimicrobium sp.]|nr:pre-toxin TG domain-containing protein [Longimicrobium sp.]